jgi:adenylosuccinate lyase
MKLKKDIFTNISPLDARYYKSNARLLDTLACYLSESAVVKYEARVEAALITVMERYGLVKEGAGDEIKKSCLHITTDEVYAEEDRTRHNIRALVNVLQRRVSNELAPFIHLGATSEDITATAQVLRIKDAFFKIIIPECLDFIDVVLDIVKREASTPQIGRTHGQHAIPTTVGYVFAGYADRFGGRLHRIIDAANELRGKVSGAVGAYNAFSLLVDDPRKFEEDVLSELGLRPADFSSQVVEPEYLLDLIHGVVSAFGVLAQIADDMRNLQRTEIGEMAERFEEGQVGSSTMPHKRNPWNFEHVKSMWKEFTPRILTRYYDQISEHQRDLTNSASGRFVVEIITAFTLSVDRLRRQFKKLAIDYEGLKKNLEATNGLFLAEPLYILLAGEGVRNAHEMVKEITLKARNEKRSIFEVAGEDRKVKEVINRESWKKLEKDPSCYTGIAAQRAKAILAIWRSEASKMRAECNAYKGVVDV